MASQIVCVKCLGQISPTDLGLAGPTTFRSENSFAGTLQNIAAPFGRSGWSIAAGYLGLFAALPFFGVFAIFAGYFGLKSITTKKPRGKFRSWFGIFSGTIFTALYLFLSFAIARQFPYLLILYAIFIIVTAIGAIRISKKTKKSSTRRS